MLPCQVLVAYNGTRASHPRRPPLHIVSDLFRHGSRCQLRMNAGRYSTVFRTEASPYELLLEARM
jgi:hypothetical protein